MVEEKNMRIDKKYNIFRKIVCYIFLLIFLMTHISFGYTQELLTLPPAGEMIFPTTDVQPVVLKGIKVYPDQPLKFDFLLDQGSVVIDEEDMEIEATKLIRYFLTSLTTSEENLWVNLSPYEGDRIIPENFSLTEMGRDLLAQDYILKQLTASILYPEGEVGKVFWKKVYAKAWEMFGTTDIPVDTFNKVWITPEKATVYVHGQNAIIKDSRLKVLLESDYIAQKEHQNSSIVKQNVNTDDVNNEVETEIAKDVMRELIIPLLEKEVNEGSLFSQLRQIYHAMVLSTWFKRHLQQSFVGRVYVDQNKVTGIDFINSQVKYDIWQQYVTAFKKGVFNYVKEEIEEVSGELIPRKYFSGGFINAAQAVEEKNVDASMLEGLFTRGMKIVKANFLPQTQEQRGQTSEIMKIGDVIISPSGTGRIVIGYNGDKVMFQFFKKGVSGVETIPRQRMLDFIQKEKVKQHRLLAGGVLESLSGTIREILSVNDETVFLRVTKQGRVYEEERPLISLAKDLLTGVVKLSSPVERVQLKNFIEELNLIKKENERLYHRMLKVIAEALGMEINGESYLTVRGLLTADDEALIIKEFSKDFLITQLKINKDLLIQQLTEYDLMGLQYGVVIFRLLEVLKKDDWKKEELNNSNREDQDDEQEEPKAFPENNVRLDAGVFLTDQHKAKIVQAEEVFMSFIGRAKGFFNLKSMRRDRALLLEERALLKDFFEQFSQSNRKNIEDELRRVLLQDISSDAIGYILEKIFEGRLDEEGVMSAFERKKVYEAIFNKARIWKTQEGLGTFNDFISLVGGLKQKYFGIYDTNNIELIFGQDTQEFIQDYIREKKKKKGGAPLSSQEMNRAMAEYQYYGGLTISYKDGNGKRISKVLINLGIDGFLKTMTSIFHEAAHDVLNNILGSSLKEGRDYKFVDEGIAEDFSIFALKQLSSFYGSPKSFEEIILRRQARVLKQKKNLPEYRIGYIFMNMLRRNIGDKKFHDEAIPEIMDIIKGQSSVQNLADKFLSNQLKDVPVGGIDLNNENLDLQEEGGQINFDQYIDTANPEDIVGFSAVVLGVTSLVEPSVFLK